MRLALRGPAAHPNAALRAPFFVTLQAVIDEMGLGSGMFPNLSTYLATGRLVTPFRQWQVRGCAQFVTVRRRSCVALL